MTTTIITAQFDYASETEPNNLPNDTGVKTLTVATTNTTTIIGGSTVVGSDEDYYKIGRSPFSNGYVGMAVQSNLGSMQPEVWLEKRTGSYDGPVISSTLIHQGTDQSNRAMGISYSAANEYYLIRVGGGRSGGYSYRVHFPRCNTPGASTVLSTDPTENDFRITAVGGSTNISLIKVNTVNSFTNPTSGTSYPTSEGTAYNGSGEQTVYLGNSYTPNVTVTGLNANTTYYVKVFNYSDCGGNLKLGTGNVFTVTTCGAAPARATVLNLSANNESSSYISSITGSIGASKRYVVKANTTNNFTAPTNGTSLPTANSVYTGGEQVVYAGDSATPNELITGLNTGTTYFFKVYTAEFCGGNYYFESTGVGSSITPVCAPPNSNAQIYLYAEPTSSHNTMSVVNFTGNNNADGKIIYISTENNFTLPTILTAANLPSVSTDYTGKTGQAAIYTGAATGFRVTTTGLLPGTTYYFAAVNYKICNGVYYFYPTGIYSQNTTCGITSELASNVVTDNINTTSFDLNSFTAPTATTNAPDGYVIKMNTVNSFSPLASGSVLPSGNAAYAGGEQVVHVGTSITPNLNITGLTEGTPYYFTIYAYNDCNGTPIYQQTGYTFTQSTLGLSFTPPTIIYGSGVTTLNATTTSTGSISYSLVNDTTGSSLSGNDFTPGTVGNTTLRITVPANGIYNEITKDFNLTISKGNPVISWNTPTTILEGVPLDATHLNASANVTGTFEYYTYYHASLNIYSGKITEGVTSLTYNSGIPTTIYTRFIPEDKNYNVIAGSTTITVTRSASSNILEITPNDIIKALSSADPALSYSITQGKLAYGDTKIWVPLKREPGETAGTYVISVDQSAQAPASFDPTGVCPTGICIGRDDPFASEKNGNITKKTKSSDVSNRFSTPMISTTANYDIRLKTGVFTITTKEQVNITLNSSDLAISFYDGNPRKAVGVTSVAKVSDGSVVSPAINFSYKGNDYSGNSYGPSNTPPTNAGDYTVKATVDESDTNYFGEVVGSFRINQRGITINPNTPQSKAYDGLPKEFEASATGVLGENIPLRILYRTGAYNSEAAPIAIGNYTVSIYAANSNNYTVNYSGNLIITNKTEVTINLTNLTQDYDGTQRSVTVNSIETSPGVAATPEPNILMTYEGINGTYYRKSTYAPTNGGTYKVHAYVNTNDVNFFGSTIATLSVFEKENVMINFGSGSLTYNGSAQGPAISSFTDSNDQVVTPTYTVSYQGTDTDDIDYGPSNTPPTNAGDYTMSVTVSASDPQYKGSDNYGFTINRANQVITFNSLTSVAPSSPDFNLTASTTSGLTITYTSSNTAVATVSGNVVSVVGMGSTIITARQVGNTNYTAAASVMQTLTVANPDITLSPKIYLQGAAINPNVGEESLMRDDLRAGSILPTTSPYSDALITSASVFTNTGGNAIVDWIWVELRDGTDNSIVVEGKSALLQRDGDIVSVDGSSPVTFTQSSGSYHIVIKHRNHLSVLSANAYSLTNSNTVIDLSSNNTSLQGGANAVVDLGNGVFAIPVGDQDENGQIQNADINAIIQLLGGSGYNKSDMDMNGQIQNTDVNTLVNPNIGKGKQF
ncbi:MBG domain-containing protein [Tenacibaculum sp. 190130A14a]|uniref:MBG domain-containing protein n=1 Tax=Tenacibaculum polynesiense TaxID=3137857 RepID=UPI0032B2B370